MKIVKHEQPEFIKTEFKCDTKLSKYLDDDPLLKNMNKSFCCGLISKDGGGKTTMLTSLLQTPHKFKKVFHRIYVFMPSSSRKSMKKDIFDQLPEEQKFEGVTLDDLNYVYENLLEDSNDGKTSLLIFDDVQSYFSKKEIYMMLLHIISNRRHLRTSLFIVAQNYLKVPKQVRQVFSDLFIWNISKDQFNTIHEELLNVSKKEFINVLKEFRKEKDKNKYSFIYIHDFDKIFINYNEIILDDDFI
jgi:hypothetical protein